MSLLKSYESFLLSNASQITAVESSLRSLTYFLPGRFKDAELAGEAVYAALNLLGLYHDSILYRLLSPASQPATFLSRSSGKNASGSVSVSAGGARTSSGTLLQHTPSPHARYTHHWADRSSLYNLAARSLVVVTYTELLAEMIARRKLGKQKAWDVVVGIEAVKAALRIALLRLTGSRPSIQPPIPEREVDPAMLDELPGGARSLRAADVGSSNGLRASKWRGAKTGFERPTLASLQASRKGDAFRNSLNGPASTRPGQSRIAASNASGAAGGSNSSSGDSDSDETLVESMTEADVNEYLLSRTLKPSDVRPAEELVRLVAGREGSLAEGLWIARPLIYAVALRKYGRKAYFPFVLSLLLEWLARTLRQRSLARSASPKNPLLAMLAGGNPILALLTAFIGGAPDSQAISDVERAEWKKRGRAFWWYLLRGPAWDGWTRPKLERIINATQNRAILGIVGGIIGDYLPLIDEYHFYSST
ncbi:peroxisome membrane protein [Ceraceosorus guamensis]|uniref:Peroxisomal membrane protein PEX16 n=1 Tax=Ceraceosorus guamensis TaxID=1522189 RepID=A0A316W6Y1_9BASI|nr:peroxisome membrane protein [Ceraceosorus guamensis]PWN43395.1 peroxisome membrane protein [Ceraceosorus guamensis]